MTEFLTRKQLREAERKGIIPAPQVVSEDEIFPAQATIANQAVADAVEGVSAVEIEPAQTSNAEVPSEKDLEKAKASFSEAKAAADNAINLRTAPEPTTVPKTTEAQVETFESPQPQVAESISEPVLTRKQLRELERSGKLPEVVNANDLGASAAVTTSNEVTPVVSEIEPELSLPTSAEIEAIDSTSENVILDAAELNLDAPSIEFSGTNLFAEPSTQSIVLDVAPEAISLPIETGEITVTGSISVLAESATGAITGGLDGLVLDSIDQQDAVTGIISTVEPISALEIINERANVGVVPKSVLRKGWWRPYVLGLIGLLMAIAAILATITIINALGA